MLKRLIEKIPLDKLRHLCLGVLYSVLIPLLAFFFGFYGALIGFIIGTMLNLYKEVYHDLHENKGNAEFLDFIYNQIPIIIVFITYLIR